VYLDQSTISAFQDDRSTVNPRPEHQRPRVHLNVVGAERFEAWLAARLAGVSLRSER